MSGHFLPHGKSFPVRAKPGSKEKAIEVILPPGLSKKFVVEKKDLPSGLPTHWRDDTNQKTYSINWLNNFGLKSQGKTYFERGKLDEKYEILVEVAEGEILFYYDGEVKPFPQDDFERPANMSNKIAARLDLGDPPIGKG